MPVASTIPRVSTSSDPADDSSRGSGIAASYRSEATTTRHREDRGIDREDAVLCRRIESGEGRDRERQEQLCDGRARGQRQHTANEPSTRRFRARVR